MVRFSLYKRHRAKGVYYYVRFWNPEKKEYEPGLSIETLRSKLGDDSFRRIGTRSAAAAIAVRAYEEGLTKKEKKSPNFVDYVLSFWDFDNSSYVKLKNKTKKESIGRDHCLNMLGTFKKNFLPHIDQSLKLPLDIFDSFFLCVFVIWEDFCFDNPVFFTNQDFFYQIIPA